MSTIDTNLTPVSEPLHSAETMQAFSAAPTDLLFQFEQEACAAAATVERVPRSPEQLAAAVRRVAPEAKRIAIAEPLDLAPELFLSCCALPGIVHERTKEALSSLDVGITDAFTGVARTGSICVCVDHDYAGSISLLARLHIAVLAGESIVERPRDLLRSDCLEGKGLKRNFVFITGPSATADMGPLVRGVHGPHRLHIVVLV